MTFLSDFMERYESEAELGAAIHRFEEKFDASVFPKLDKGDHELIKWHKEIEDPAGLKFGTPVPSEKPLPSRDSYEILQQVIRGSVASQIRTGMLMQESGGAYKKTIHKKTLLAIEDAIAENFRIEPTKKGRAGTVEPGLLAQYLFDEVFTPLELAAQEVENHSAPNLLPPRGGKGKSNSR